LMLSDVRFRSVLLGSRADVFGNMAGTTGMADVNGIFGEIGDGGEVLPDIELSGKGKGKETITRGTTTRGTVDTTATRQTDLSGASGSGRKDDI